MVTTARLRVGLDHLPGSTHYPGVGRYSRELARALVHLPAAAGVDLDLRLAAVGGAPRIVPKGALGLDRAEQTVRRLDWRVPRRIAGPLLRWIGADRLLGGVDVFHRMAPGQPPLARARSVFAVSELPRQGDAEEAALRAALNREDLVLFFSEAARGQVVERLGVSLERTGLVPVGADHWARDLAEAGPEPVREDPPLVLVLGALRRERHHDQILDAFDTWIGGGARARLVFAGGPGDGAEHVRRRLSFASARAHVHWEQAPSEAQCARWVASASLLVHLAEREATAVTPLEALAVGTPVLVSDCAVFRETLGDLALYIPTPLSLRHRKALPELLAAGVARALDPKGDSARRAHGAGYTWAQSARAHAVHYRALAQR